MLCGLDEAGRGPVIGPLVAAAVMAGGEEVEELIELGVRDSKLLSPSRRERLYGCIRSRTVCRTIVLQPRELDSEMARASLNAVEARCFAELIDYLAPEVAYVDAADTVAANFERLMLRHLKTRPRLVVEHRADERYPLVAAASIVAKVERDREIKRLQRVYGDFGSGYASDPKTRSFLESCLNEKGSLPECVRMRWRTARRLLNARLDG